MGIQFVFCYLERQNVSHSRVKKHLVYILHLAVLTLYIISGSKDEGDTLTQWSKCLGFPGIPIFPGWLEKSRIREIKHLWTDADSSTDAKKIRLERQNLLVKKQEKKWRQFYTLYKQKFSNLRPLLSITFPQGFLNSKKFGHWTSGSGDKTNAKNP